MGAHSPTPRRPTTCSPQPRRAMRSRSCSRPSPCPRCPSTPRLVRPSLWSSPDRHGRGAEADAGFRPEVDLVAPPGDDATSFLAPDHAARCSRNPYFATAHVAIVAKRATATADGTLELVPPGVVET